MTTLNRVLSYTKKYWKTFLLSAVSASLYGAFSAGPAKLIENTVDSVFVNGLSNLLIPFILGFVSLFALKGIFMYLSSYYMNWVGNRVINDIRNDLFKKIIYYPVSFYKEKTTGHLMSYFLNDIQMIQNAATNTIKNGVRSFFEATFFIFLAFWQNWKLAAIMLLVSPIIAVSIKKMGVSIKKASILIQNSMGNVASMLQEVFVGIREVKAFNGEEIETRRFKKNLKKCFFSIMKNVHVESLAPAFMETVSMIGGGVVLYVAAHQIMRGTITAGQLTSFFASVLLSYQPLKRLINVYSEVQYGIAAANRIFDIMDRVYPSSKMIAINSSYMGVISNIKFDNVSFQYNKDTKVFDSFNLVMEKGNSIGIIGPSGSGKSTFCDMLLGFVSPTSGNIFINGVNISDIPKRDLRNKIGYVGQKTFLFNDSVFANVSYGQNKSEKEVVNACVTARADKFIKGLPNGYKTIVGENGNMLSGGQKQRLTIARALLKDPEILIFDEATSSLDQESENLIRIAIEAICKEKTVIIISHRLSFIEKVDEVFLVNDKKINRVDKRALKRGFYQETTNSLF